MSLIPKVSSKFYLLRDLQNIIPVTAFLADIYEKNSKPGGKYYDRCRQFARISELVIKIGYTIYSVSLIILSGIVEMLVTGVVKPCLNIYVPGVHDYTTAAFITLMAYNYLIVITSFLTTPIGDMLFFIIFANVPIVPMVIQGQLDELRDKLETETGSLAEIKYRIMQYILMHQSYNE